MDDKLKPVDEPEKLPEKKEEATEQAEQKPLPPLWLGPGDPLW